MLLYIPQSAQAPVNIGDVMGSARVYIGENFYGEVTLVATQAAARHDLKTSLEKVLNAHFQQMTHGPVDIVLPEW